MTPSKKTDHVPIASKSDAIHKHLQIQFEGLTTKFAQELDEIIHAKEELREDLEYLKQQLNAACEHFHHSKKKGNIVAIEQFFKEYNQAIEHYKKAPKGYCILARNGIAQETMDNIVARYTSSINSAINYTKEYNDLNLSTSELSTTLVLLETIKAKFIAAKIQFSSTHKQEEDKEYSPKQKPSNTL